VGRERVARIMRQEGLREISPRKWTTTTVGDQAASLAPDLVKRDFQAQGPKQLWVAEWWAGYSQSICESS
jgi:transposase InsO family protein